MRRTSIPTLFMVMAWAAPLTAFIGISCDAAVESYLIVAPAASQPESPELGTIVVLQQHGGTFLRMKTEAGTFMLSSDPSNSMKRTSACIRAPKDDSLFPIMYSRRRRSAFSTSICSISHLTEKTIAAGSSSTPSSSPLRRSERIRSLRARATRVTATRVTAEQVTAEQVTATRVTAEQVTATRVTAEQVTATRVTATREEADMATTIFDIRATSIFRRLIMAALLGMSLTVAAPAVAADCDKPVEECKTLGDECVSTAERRLEDFRSAAQKDNTSKEAKTLSDLEDQVTGASNAIIRARTAADGVRKAADETKRAIEAAKTEPKKDVAERKVAAAKNEEKELRAAADAKVSTAFSLVCELKLAAGGGTTDRLLPGRLGVRSGKIRVRSRFLLPEGGHDGSTTVSSIGQRMERQENHRGSDVDLSDVHDLGKRTGRPTACPWRQIGKSVVGDPKLDGEAFGIACSEAKSAYDKMAPLIASYLKSKKNWNTAVEKSCELSCSGDNTFCIEATTGEPFCKKKNALTIPGLPKQVEGGTTFTVRVMGLTDTGGTYSIGVASSFLHDSLFAPATAPSGAAPNIEKINGQGELALDPNEPKFGQLGDEKTMSIPSDSKLLLVKIVYAWTPDIKDERAPRKKQYVIELDHGKYYLEVGLLMPVVFGGSRTVTPTLVPGTGGQQRLTVSNDTVVSPALALNVFPGGRRNGRVSAFGPYRAGDLVGFQFALDLDLKHAFDRFYLGLVLEPIAGFSVNPGMAMVKGQFLPDGHAAGMLVPSGETFTPHSKYMPRPYLGLTITNEILTTITGAARAIRGNVSGTN